MVTAKVVFPSIQELRYGARRLVDACEILRSDPDSASIPSQIAVIDTHLVEAIQNVIKARHDATDASIMFLHKKLNTMVGQFGMELMILYFPKFSSLHRELREAGLRIVQSRRNRPKLEDSYLEIQTKHLKALIELNDEMTTSEETLMAMVEAKQKERLEFQKSQAKLVEEVETRHELAIVKMREERVEEIKRERRFNAGIAVVSAMVGGIIAMAVVRWDHEIKALPVPGTPSQTLSTHGAAPVSPSKTNAIK